MSARQQIDEGLAIAARYLPAPRAKIEAALSVTRPQFDPPVRTTGAYNLPLTIRSPAHACWALRSAKFPAAVADALHWALTCNMLDNFASTAAPTSDTSQARWFLSSALWLDDLLVGD